MKCNKCGKDYEGENCPYCSETTSKVKKPIYKKWWFWLIVVVIIISGIFANLDKSNNATTGADTTVSQGADITTITTDAATIDESAAAAQAQEDMETFKNSCEEINYKDALRNIDSNIGRKIKVTVKIRQIVDSFGKQYYRGYSDGKEGYGLYLENEYYIIDERVSKDLKLLDTDIITIYGTVEQPKDVVRGLTFSSDEIFAINMKYCDLVNE